MTPSDWLVLQDTIYSLFPPGDASDFMKWMRNPGAVRTLLSLNGSMGYETDEEHFPSTVCPSCASFHEQSVHNTNCAIVTVWVILGDARGNLEIHKCHDSALRSEKSRRSAAKGVATRRARAAAAPPDKLRDYNSMIGALRNARKVRFDGP